MDRALFEQQLLRAAAEARDFARRVVEETLPDEMRYRVHLNASYDGHATPDFRLFPEDSSRDVVYATKNLAAHEVVELLWREGRVPQWADLAVVDETAEATVLEVLCAGRFTGDESRLYYAERGTGCFGPKGPALPLDYVEGRRFSIHHRTACWSLDDLARASMHRDKVAFLTLHGRAFDDIVLVEIETFRNAHLLELDAVCIAGPGLASLARFPRLRFARLSFDAVEELSFEELPTLDPGSLALTRLPPRLSSVAKLVAATPKLAMLTLGSNVQTTVDGPLIHDALRELDLRFPRIPDWVCIPASLRALSVRAPDATDAEVTRLLAACPADLESLTLCGTPVSDAIFDELERLQGLRYVNARGTGVASDALERFGRGRARFRWLVTKP